MLLNVFVLASFFGFVCAHRPHQLHCVDSSLCDLAVDIKNIVFLQHSLASKDNLT